MSGSNWAIAALQTPATHEHERRGALGCRPGREWLGDLPGTERTVDKGKQSLDTAPEKTGPTRDERKKAF